MTHDHTPTTPDTPDTPAAAPDARAELHVALASLGAAPYLAWCLGLTPAPERAPDVAPYEWPGMAVVA